jgi:hypothetical protein
MLLYRSKGKQQKEDTMDISWWRLKKKTPALTQKKKTVVKRKRNEHKQRERDEQYPSWVNAIMEKY